jgi:NADPH:quinone reductase-like Zn-dependent oxidoreductase
MKAVLIEKYGGVEVLQYKEYPVPQIKDDEILINVKNSSVNPVDWKVRKGMLRFIPGQKLPKILGGDFSGIIENTGSKITEFKTNDKVFGMISAVIGGTYAEYAVAKSHQITLMPKNLNFKEAATIPLAALTAYQALSKLGNLKKGDKVCINGCSGGVGHFAVQIAKAMGADVTGVCSTKNVEFAKKLGSDKVIDYSKEQVLKPSQRYDIFFDAVANKSYFKVKKYLNKNGKYVTTLPSISVMINSIFGFFSSKTGKMINVKPNSEDLRILSNLIKLQNLKVHLDKTYDLKEIQKAHLHSETGRVVGKLALSIN